MLMLSFLCAHLYRLKACNSLQNIFVFCSGCKCFNLESSELQSVTTWLAQHKLSSPMQTPVCTSSRDAKE